MKGRREGTIPAWISGSLVQNGPGKFYFGSSVFQHLFDGSALVRKFCISQGEVSYQCQFVKSQSYKVTELTPHLNMREIISSQKNCAADKIVVPEFGTPVRGKWWKRLLNVRATVLSDNTMITVYPFNGSESSECPPFVLLL